MIDVNNIEEYLELKDYVEKMYLGYSVSILQERAIPYLSDGQKPVQRRILYAMKEMNVSHNTPPKKSARIVGDVIGKFHPHGDSSVYEAMVRMAQNWSLRYPLVDGQGNFGSRGGDSAAAMRYTESRLSAFAEHVLLSELKLGTVDFKGNYDNTMQEPKNLPSRLNTLLLNGATGIAVGMSSDIPSHNIKELSEATIAAIQNSKISHDEIMDLLKGPDLPNGGQIIDSKETINKVYEDGHGTLKVRARWKMEKMAHGQWQIVVYEMPPLSSTENVLETIDKIINPPSKKDKNGKTKPLSKNELQKKNFLNSILSKAYDDSDQKTPVRLILEPKSSRQNPEEFMEILTGLLDLEKSMKVNLTSVGLDNLPKRKNILDLIQEWIFFRFHTMTRRTEFLLKKTQDRIHILEGRMIALKSIDEVIKIIRQSEDPKADLMNKIKVSEIQAEDILEIRLRQLAKMEYIKVENELKKLLKEEKYLLSLLKSKTKMNNLMIEEIKNDTEMFTDERRTLIKEDKVTITKSSDTILDEPITIIFTQKGWLTQRKGHNVETETLQLKNEDNIKYIIEGRSTNLLCAISSNGRAYSIKTTEVPFGKGGFVHVNSLISLENNSEIVDVCFNNDEKIFIFNDKGYGFISNKKNLETKNKAGKHFMTLPKDAKIFPFVSVENEPEFINLLSSDYRILCFKYDELKEFKELDKGKGYQLMKLPKDDKIIDYSFLNNEIYYYEGKKKIKINENNLSEFLSKRALRGKKVKENTKLSDN